MISRRNPSKSSVGKPPGRRFLRVSLLSLLAAGSAHAANFTWTGGTAGDASGTWSDGVFNGQAYTAADTLNINGTAAKTITLSGTVTSPASLTISGTGTTGTPSAGGITLTGGSVGGTLLKTGSADLTLASANTFGAVTISSGKFLLNNAAGLGTTGTLSVNGGASNGVTGSYSAASNGLFFYDSTALASSYTFSKNVSFGPVASATTYGMAMAQGTSAAPLTTTLSGNLTGASNLTLWLDVAATAAPNFSTWVLGGDNSGFAGTIRLNRGNIVFNSAAAMGTGAIFLQTNGSDGITQVSGTTPPSNLTFGFAGTVANAITLRLGSGGSSSIDTGANNVTLSNSLTLSSGIFNKNGTGTLAITGVLDTLIRSAGIGGAPSGGNVSASLRAGTLDVSAMTGSTTTFNNLDAAAGSTLALGTKGLSVASGTFAGVITGTGGSLTETGPGTLTLSGQNTFTGPVTINGGTVSVGVTAAPAGTTGALGVGTAGKTIMVNAGATLSGTASNWFGSAVNTGTLPVITVNGGTLSTTRYTTIGALNLNGATVTNNVTTDTGGYQAFALRGDVTVGGTAASTITATAASATAQGYHLGANTTFTVADATGDANPDLIVSAPLRNQSNDFAGAAGGLTKAGAGTMLLSGTNTYTGATAVNAGTLLISGTLTGTPLTVASGANALVSGSGTISGSTASVQSGGKFGGVTDINSPSAGSISSATTVSSGGMLQVGALTGIVGNGTTSLDGLVVSGNLNLNAGSIISLTLGGTVNGTPIGVLGSGNNHAVLFKLGGTWSFSVNQKFSFLGTQAGTYSNIIYGLDGTETNLIMGTSTPWDFSDANYKYAFAYNAGNGGVDLTVTAVPEPGAALSLLACIGVLVVARRRRQRQAV